jgi:hypothetical protein
MNEDKVGFTKKMMASLCHHCLLCISGRKRPESVVAKYCTTNFMLTIALCGNLSKKYM